MQKSEISKSSKVLLILIGIAIVVSVGIIVVNAFSGNSNQQTEMYNEGSVGGGAPF